MNDDEALNRMLKEVDVKLPALTRATQGFSANIIVGRGSCGLGSTYYRATEAVARESHLCKWLVAAEQRASQSAKRDVAALAEAQRDALRLAQFQKEEAMLQATEERRLQKRQDAIRAAEAARAEREALRQRKRDAEEKLNRERQLLAEERERERLRHEAVLEAERHNALLLAEEHAESQDRAWEHQIEIHNSVQRQRNDRRQLLQGIQRLKRDEAQKSREKEKRFLQRRATEYRKVATENKKSFSQRKLEHQYAVQMAMARKEEEVENAVQAAKAAPNAEVIRQKHEAAAGHVRQLLLKRRERETMLRSVSSLF